MCGIAGFIKKRESVNLDGVLERIVAAESFRGPDGQGVVIKDRVGFGHRRLKIVDLSDASAQPMTDVTLGLTLVFNGCLYNYRELKRQLIDLGYVFVSQGDTEVLLKSWHAWGADCLQLFRGMFAFAIYEHDSRRVILVRDRSGIKPLYYATTNDAFFFSSTLPSLLQCPGVDTSIDASSLTFYLTFHGIVPDGGTIVSGIRKLPPASYRIIERDGSSREARYWELTYGDASYSSSNNLNRIEWRDQLMSALQTSVERRLVGDVPLGLFLSGGLDSSLILALMSKSVTGKVRTFSVGFESAHGECGDEFEFSDRMASLFNTEHERIKVSQKELFDALPATVMAMSEPMVSHDNVGFFLLSKAASKSVRIVLSGQGADEVFAGYHWYPKMAVATNAVDTYGEVFFDRSSMTLDGELLQRWRVKGDLPRRFVSEHFTSPGAQDALDKALRIDTTVMLVEDPIKRVDNMTMAWGLEGRLPFMDQDVLELAARMPSTLKLASGGKGILKDVADSLLPHDIVHRQKGYFPVPALKHLDGPLLTWAKDILSSVPCHQRGMYSQAYIKRLIDDPSAYITPLRGSELWQVSLLEYWCQLHNL